MKPPIPEKTRYDQTRASDPQKSAWVAANAGSGKTHVLAQRVIRLLLQGARPDRILCLTFTKAAATNMSERVFRTLANWATFSDAELGDAIAATGEKRPEPAGLAAARKLFARALETPGGLKTLTIHAFCERLLHIAPFEANVPANFSVLEDQQKSELLDRARADVLAAAAEDAALRSALEIVARDGGVDFEKTIGSALEKRAAFRELNQEDAQQRLRTALGAGAHDTVETVLRAIGAGDLPPEDWPKVADFLATGSATDQKNASAFRAAHQHWRAEKLEAASQSLASIYLKSDGGPAKLLTKALATARPDMLAALEAEQSRLMLLWDRLAAARVCERTLALAVVVNAVADRYERDKSMRQCIDFDDMIERTSTLLTRSSAAWLLKKLDGGIDHILLDEAQDTSASQWEIVERISADFFAGEGQAKHVRTLFVVGDEKQSIFSFQGAQPELFSTKRRMFAQKIREADQQFESVELHLSFRSAPGVLAAVDEIFSSPERSRGLYGGQEHVKTVHEAWKREQPSIVELWDVIAALESEPSRDWRLPLDYRDETDPAVASARRIAGVIAGWLRDGEPIGTGQNRRAIRPDDIMILVRRRDAFFEAMIRALKEKGVPTAGSDRLALAEHIAVMDLLAIARFALLPEDDLTLATVLKSPVFGLGDEDLIALAPNREGALIRALQTSERPEHQAACAKLDLLGRMARELPPFDFFARLLGPMRAREKILARLGPEAGDVLDEFLNLALQHEGKTTPNLRTFVAEVESSEGTIKRDLDTGAGQVRVMTIHAAKGLESRIVFLPDVCATPTTRLDFPIFLFETPAGPLPAWSPRKELDCARVGALRADKKEAGLQEYRRLLYVAMTRAEERVYIGGHRGKNALQPESWRLMLEQALSANAQTAPAPWSQDETVLRYADQPSDGPCEKPEAAGPAEKTEMPDWLTRPAPAPQA
ncbi:ATP-dependent helicase/nuclease subunit A [Rhodoblastus acidophilus]|uniref:double-strand break repair helicase AddA n=1 Tax=Rhodoblastus acidophilus TaxID=1074 RepID=UPI0022247631|nr:double-strand break repair helicase AddA [Rhodoblastus acidophilus]MCW2282401.1 ATP-dependent helicase/nuclease subunit A [Rhodoblastus acidophilus]MCW2331194.1 ATP-dependent helicase/nuclease subunit A [Rhodoblastus acidophilus]